MKNFMITNKATASAVTSMGVVPLGNALHGYGRAIRLNNDAIVLNAPGYYKILVNLTMYPAATGNLTAQLYENGVPIAGTAQAAKVTAIGDAITLPIIWAVRRKCCDDAKSYTVVVDNAGEVDAITTITEGE